MSFQAHEPLTHENAHSRPVDLDPRKNGPFLDDIRREQERAYREGRMKAGLNAAASAEVTEEEENNDPESE